MLVSDPMAAVDVVEREAATFARLLSTGALDAPVPSCPGWTLADLAGHLGGIHRWARQSILAGRSDVPAPVADQAMLEPWFREGAAALVATLRQSDPDSDCWTFARPRAVRFWMRRQAHETTIHRWDAAVALGSDDRIDEWVALDGIGEVVGMFVPRQVRLGRLAPGPEVVELLTPAGERAVLCTEPSLTTARPTATVAGPAEALLLLLWRRTGVDDPRLVISGDTAGAKRLLTGPLTP